eukprot:555288-Ditylum_brightwellii.AAC.1
MQFQANFDQRLAKIISVVNILTKRMAKNSMSTQSASSYELYNCNMENCKKLSCSLFKSSKQLQSFKHVFNIAIPSSNSLITKTSINIL